MGKLLKEDIYSIGLLYSYIYSKGIQKIVSESALEEYYNCVEHNYNMLEKENDNNFKSNYRKERIYDYSVNESGKGYYILKSDFDMEKAKLNYLSSVSNNCLVATRLSNALDCLGLVKSNETIKVKRDVLTREHKGEYCAICEYNISPDLLDDIRRENSEYKDLTYEELLDEIGFCEFEQNQEQVKKMGYWCPKFTENEKLRKKEYIKRKLN